MSADACGTCGHARVFHQVGTGSGVPVGQAYCDDRHAPPCACRQFVPHWAIGDWVEVATTIDQGQPYQYVVPQSTGWVRARVEDNRPEYVLRDQRNWTWTVQHADADQRLRSIPGPEFKIRYSCNFADFSVTRDQLRIAELEVEARKLTESRDRAVSDNLKAQRGRAEDSLKAQLSLREALQARDTARRECRAAETGLAEALHTREQARAERDEARDRLQKYVSAVHKVLP